jgi:hypothetical protein
MAFFDLTRRRIIALLGGQSALISGAIAFDSALPLRNDIKKEKHQMTNPPGIPFPRTSVEMAAGVTPTNFAIPSHAAVGDVLMERYGGAGDNATLNDSAFSSAAAVAGKIDAFIGFTEGTAGQWLFANPIILSGTGQAQFGMGPPVGGAGATPARLKAITGRPVIKFISGGGLSSTTDCVTLGSGNVPQVQVVGMQFNFNNLGRDGMVVTGSNRPLLDNIVLSNSQRDSLVLSPNGSSAQFIEKLEASVQIAGAGRHAVRISLQGAANTTPYVNECLWRLLEVRGLSKNYAGGSALYMECAAGGTTGAAFSSSGAKISDHLFLNTEFDCAYVLGQPVPSANPVSGSSNVVIQNIISMKGAWENAEPTVIATTAASGTGTTATLSFALQSVAPPVGNQAVISGVTPSGYNGTYTITASSRTSVSYANTTTEAQSGAGSIALTAPAGFSVAANGATWVGYTAIANNNNSYWGDNGIDPSIQQITNFDFSFNRTQFSGPSSIVGNNTNGTSTAADYTATRTGTPTSPGPLPGRDASLALANSTSGTAAQILQWNGGIVFFCNTGPGFTAQAQIKPTGGLILQQKSTIYSGTGAPSRALGVAGDFYFRQDTPGTANQRLYVNNSGTWAGVI